MPPENLRNMTKKAYAKVRTREPKRIVMIGGVGWQKRRPTMDCDNVRKWYTELENDGAIPHGQPTAVWDDGGWFKIFEHGSNKFVNNLADCITGSCAWTGTERINGACN